VARALAPADIERAFDLGEHFKHIDHIFDRVFGTTFTAEPTATALRQAQGKQPAVSVVEPRAPR
jgi:hypothetical protein